jgi:hypothetical protein
MKLLNQLLSYLIIILCLYGAIKLINQTKLEDFEEKINIKHYVKETGEVVKARITCYEDKGIMASGKYVYAGAIATSDRTIPFGTKIIYKGKTYMVEDRTNKRIHKEFGMLTIDIWQESCAGFGRHFDNIIIK